VARVCHFGTRLKWSRPAADSTGMKTPGPWLRRAIRLGLAIAAFVALASPAPRGAEPEPASGLERLRAGNSRFVKGAAAPMPSGPAARQAPAAGQQPFAMVLSCADARVPPEFVFSAGLGDLFVVRAAGAVVDKSVTASLEYGVTHLHVPLLVVMGHEACDVVRDASSVEPREPAMDFLATHIRAGLRHGSGDRAGVRGAVLATVEQAINDLMGSSVLRAAATGGQLQVVGAYYELGTGQVVFSEPIGAPPTARH